jgi:hypothetical protein
MALVTRFPRHRRQKLCFSAQKFRRRRTRFVAQVGNLLYCRLAVGSRWSDTALADYPSAIQQNTILRYFGCGFAAPDISWFQHRFPGSGEPKSGSCQILASGVGQMRSKAGDKREIPRLPNRTRKPMIRKRFETARQRLGLRWPSTAFAMPHPSKAPEGWRTPKPGGRSDSSSKRSG